MALIINPRTLDALTDFPSYQLLQAGKRRDVQRVFADSPRTDNSRLTGPFIVPNYAAMGAKAGQNLCKYVYPQATALGAVTPLTLPRPIAWLIAWPVFTGLLVGHLGSGALQSCARALAHKSISHGEHGRYQVAALGCILSAYLLTEMPSVLYVAIERGCIELGAGVGWTLGKIADSVLVGGKN
jgi:hypothetical protein